MLKTGMIEWPTAEEMLNMKDPFEWCLKKITFYFPTKDDGKNQRPDKRRKGVLVESNNFKSPIYSYEQGELGTDSSYSFELEENQRIKYVDSCKKCQEYIFFGENKEHIVTLKSSHDHSLCPKEAVVNYNLKEGEVVLGFGLVFIGLDL